MNDKIYDCPCDVGPCVHYNDCRTKALECKAVKKYYSHAWFRESLRGVNRKPMKKYNHGVNVF